MDAVTESLRNYQNDEAKRDRDDAVLQSAFESAQASTIAKLLADWPRYGKAIRAGMLVDAQPEQDELPRRLVEAVNSAIDDYAWELAKKEVARS